MPNRIRQFFAVTFSDRSVSLYRVSADPDEGPPRAEKIALVGQSGIQVGEFQGNRPLLAICTKLLWYDGDEVHRDPNGVDRKGWGACSSWVAGVFLRLQDADWCFIARDHQIGDPRWIEYTYEVKAAIGDDHPSISFPSSVEFGLIEATSPAI